VPGLSDMLRNVLRYTGVAGRHLPDRGQVAEAAVPGAADGERDPVPAQEPQENMGNLGGADLPAGGDGPGLPGLPAEAEPQRAADAGDGGGELGVPVPVAAANAPRRPITVFGRELTGEEIVVLQRKIMKKKVAQVWIGVVVLVWILSTLLFFVTWLPRPAGDAELARRQQQYDSADEMDDQRLAYYTGAGRKRSVVIDVDDVHEPPPRPPQRPRRPLPPPQLPFSRSQPVPQQQPPQQLLPAPAPVDEVQRDVGKKPVEVPVEAVKPDFDKPPAAATIAYPFRSRSGAGAVTGRFRPPLPGKIWGKGRFNFGKGHYAHQPNWGQPLNVQQNMTTAAPPLHWQAPQPPQPETAPVPAPVPAPAQPAPPAPPLSSPYMLFNSPSPNQLLCLLSHNCSRCPQ
jgi:hypothetical protein